ncbi:E3 ubiquitin-protein ligase TRIM35-like [Anguilla rostrata]|uniref:E3 ubiquitin-protein ligase TRIM35-like n=1 Tax=Anguilla rostrata TaxID=7938 RepID=UPI0030D316E8
MAVRLSSLEDDLTCPVCCDVFQDPAVLRCSHSFCRKCLDTYWKDKSVKDCPSCRRRSSTDKPPANLSLRNIVEFYQKEQSEAGGEGGGGVIPLCSQHGEKLQFFCTNDQELICVVCQVSKQHRGHNLCPIDEAASDLKEEVQICLKPLDQKLDSFQKMKQQCLKTSEHIQSQARQTEVQIRKTFEELHHFLRVEESTRIAALFNETELKSVIMNEKIDHLTKKMTSLSNTIRDIEKQIEAEDISFLKAYRQTKGRTNCTLQDPEPVLGALIDVATHLGSLKFKIWEKMLDTVQYTPVTLDPNTAACWLSLSDDLTVMRYHGEQSQIPDNPERRRQCVLGAEGYTSGRHGWEVEVGNNTSWYIGVVKESVGRKGVVDTNPTQGYWVLGLRDGELYGACAQSHSPLKLKKKPQRVRVALNYEKGQVSFFDQSDTSHIYTFKEKFTEKLFPGFSPSQSEKGRNAEPLKICPAKVSIVKM